MGMIGTFIDFSNNGKVIPFIWRNQRLLSILITMKTKEVGKGLYARCGEWAQSMRRENHTVMVSLQEAQKGVEKDTEDGIRGLHEISFGFQIHTKIMCCPEPW